MKLKQNVALCTSVLLALSACKSTDVPLNSEIQVPQTFTQAEAARGSSQIAQWWQNWHDPVLSQLIEQGLAQSYDVRLAISRLNEARATSRMAEADLGPTVGLTGNAGAVRGNVDNPIDDSVRNILSRNPLTSELGDSSKTIKGNNLSAGLVASWEPDIFGRKRSDADAAKYAALGRQEQVYGAQMLVAGDIADNYFKARAAQKRLQSANRSVAVLSRMLEYVQGRFKAGHTAAYDVDQTQSSLAAMKGKQSTIQAEYASYVRNIAVLTGQVPQHYSLPASSTDVLAHQPAAPSGQTPEGLLERRPDLRANAAQVKAYAAKLASAKADLLPRFSINFLGEGARIGIDGNSDLTGWASLLSLGISVPIFTNGRIKANIAAADARLKTALLSYDQVLLRALGDVDNAYQAQAALTRQNALLNTALGQSSKQASDAQKLFRYGDITLDQTLRAELNEQSARDNLTLSQLARAQMLVNLYKALGGGWQEAAIR